MAFQLSDLSITKRGLSTAQIMSLSRVNAAASGTHSPPTRAKAGSISSSNPSSRFVPPVSRTESMDSKTPMAASGSSPLGGGRVLAPPPYARSTSTSSQSSLSGKRAPPPPPALKPRPSYGPKPTYVTALFDFQAQSEGDLSFQTGDRIELVQRTESVEDWWTGKLNGLSGVFPANYVQTV